MEFEKLLKKISPKLRAISRKLNRKNSFFNDDDLYQEAVLYLWDKCQQQETEDKTESYLLQGCYYYLQNYLRKARKKVDLNSVSLNNFVDEQDHTFEQVLSLPVQQFDPLAVSLLAEEVKSRLTEREQKVFSLFLEGFTIREIGRRLGVSHVMVVKIENKIRLKCQEMEE